MGTAGVDPVDRSTEPISGTVAGTGTSVSARWTIEPIDADRGTDPAETADDGVDPNASIDANGAPSAGEHDSIILVQVQLTNSAPVKQHVQVRNRLGGPVLFPRRQGVPEAGWDRDGFAGSVDPESTRALGYACPAPIETPPIEMEASGTEENGRTADGVGPIGAVDGATAAAVIRAYGDPAPPVAPVRQSADSSGETREETADATSTADATANATTDTATTADRSTPQSAESSTDDDDPRGSTAPPPAVTAWFEEIETRLARAERLEDGSLADATAVLVETEGLDGALADAETLPGTAETLRELAAEATALAERAEAVDVPVEALRGIA